MDPSTYNQMLSQMLYGGALPYGANLGNATSWQGAATGAPAPGMPGAASMGGAPGAGMLGTPPPGGGMPMHPNMSMPSAASAAGGPMGYGQVAPAQGSADALRQTMLPYTQNAYPAGQNPFQLQQPMSQYAGPTMAPPMGGNGGGGGAQ